MDSVPILSCNRIGVINATEQKEFGSILKHNKMNKENIEPKNQIGGANSEFAIKKQKEGVFYHIIGANIIKARNKKGFTQEQLSDKLGISRVSVGNIESGKQRLPVHLLYSVAYALEVDINYILTNIKKDGKGLCVESVVIPSPAQPPAISSNEGETVEQAAQAAFAKMYDLGDRDEEGFISFAFLHGFNEGAQWQAQHSYTEDKWISVDDSEKPKNDQWVLCAANTSKGFDNLLPAYSYNAKYDDYTGYGEAQRDARVTHWQPLPSPPTK